MNDPVGCNAVAQEEADRLLDSHGLDVGSLLTARRHLRPAIVVVPVFNGGRAVSTCLDSLQKNRRNERVIVIDDASTDADVVAELDRRLAAQEIELIRHDVNWGYTRTANQGLSLSEGADVVLLNSDTEVGPGWLAGLQRVACSRDDVATVSAVSDNAGAMAMPVAGEANVWPGHLSWAEIARAAARAELPWAVETPTGHGFCMLVTADAIGRVGQFDESEFPRGYGEENDFCMRALELGMANLVAPRVFVRHERSQSFGSERGELMREGRMKVDARHPSYTARIRTWLSSPDMSNLRASYESLRHQLAEQHAVLPRRLYVLHRASGGTPATNFDLMSALAATQESYLLESVNAQGLELSRVTPGGVVPLVKWTAERPFAVGDTWRQDYAEVAAQLLLTLGVELIHVRHLINHPLTTIPSLARRLGIPLVVSTHDFYLSCPSVHLLDEADRFCGGVCTPGEGTCRLPTPFVQAAPPLKHRWVYEWQRRTDSVLEAADAIVATTSNARRVLAATHPRHRSAIRVIEHGRDLDTRLSPLRADGIRKPGVARIVATANWDPHKGVDYLRELATQLGPRLEWHVLGKRSDLLADVAISHGPYNRDSLRSILADIDPDFSAILSIWPETYSHTLTEAWALGVPVVATDIGAVAERIRRHGGGLLLPVDDPTEGARRLKALVADSTAISRLRATVPRDGVRSRAAMAESYRSLYASIDSRARPVRVGYVVHGSLGSHPGSAHVRLLRRLTSLALTGRIVAQQIDPVEVGRVGELSEVDVVIVQRDALTIDSETFLAAITSSGVRLVVEVDDDLLNPQAAERLGAHEAEFRARIARFSDLLDAADAILASTDVVASRLSSPQRVQARTIPNELDPRLWCNAVDSAPTPAATKVRLLYMGSRTHVDDLRLLEPVVAKLNHVSPVPVVLEVVGVADSFVGDDWFRRIPIPRSARNYPDFVTWLRSQASRWTAAVAPLVDSAFNQAKSDLKLLEYAMLGLPAVASDIGPYRGAHHLAALAANGAAEWCAAIQRILDSPVDAATKVADSQAWVRSQRMLTPQRLEAWLGEVLGTDRAKATYS